jgi:hypothetical protein
MSLKQLLGLEKTNISEAEIMTKIMEAQHKDLDSVEFVVEGNIVHIGFPHIHEKV